MPKPTAAHRGRYKAKSKPTASMPLLLRRALAQLRGDPPESWPNEDIPCRTENGTLVFVTQHSPHSPFPTTLNMLGTDHPLNAPAPRADLLAMLARLDRADIGRAWSIFNHRCATIECDPGDTMLFILINAVMPVHAMSTADRKARAKRASEAAKVLSDAIGAALATEMSLDGLLPPNPSERDAFLAVLRHASTPESAQTAQSAQQIRGTKWQRIAVYVAHQVAARAGIPVGVAIASAATGTRLTSAGIAKAAKRGDTRGYHVRLRVTTKKPN